MMTWMDGKKPPERRWSKPKELSRKLEALEEEDSQSGRTCSNNSSRITQLPKSSPEIQMLWMSMSSTQNQRTDLRQEGYFNNSPQKTGRS
jgi:hypothetical protein